MDTSGFRFAPSSNVHPIRTSSHSIARCRRPRTWKRYLFATYAKGGHDAAVKSFAEKTLSKLEMHKMHVLKLVVAR